MLRVILTLALTMNGIVITIQTPSGCHPCYVQVDTTDGLSATPQIFQFDLAPNDQFGHAVDIDTLPTLHLQTESARVRVWTETSGTDADADQTITIPVSHPALHRVYLPI